MAEIRWETPHEHVGLATIDRPERRNAMNAELCDELRAHIENADGVRAIVLTGEGVAFCAGADIARRAQDTGGLDHGGGDTFRPAFERVLDAIVASPAPVIAAVNGAALGAGMQLAVACDLRVVAPTAKIGIPAAKLGVLLSAPNIARLAVLMGQGAARDILLTGRIITVDEARENGFAERVADDALGHRARARDRGREARAAERPRPQARAERRRRTGRAQRAGSRRDTRPRRSRVPSDDLQEGLAAFGEKRPPAFEGH